MATTDLKELPRTKAKTKSNVTLTAIKTPIGLEKELRKFLRYMTKTIRTRFENKVLNALNQKTVSKFQDAQNGSWATIFNKMSAEYENSIVKQFSNERLKKFVEKLYGKTARLNKDRFNSTVNNKLGIDLDKVLKTDGLSEFTHTQSLQTASQLEVLRNETVSTIKQNVFRMMGEGATLGELHTQVKKSTGMRLKKGDLTARNELKNFNMVLANARAENVGVTKAIWRNVQDSRVRGNPSGKYANANQDHWSLEGKEYDIRKGIKDPRSGKMIKPGSEINCRCYAEFIVPLEEGS